MVYFYWPLFVPLAPTGKKLCSRNIGLFTLNYVSQYNNILPGVNYDQWQKAEVNLAAGTSRVVFRARRGPSDLGNIAIDDVSVITGRCSGGIIIITCLLFTQRHYFYNLLSI